MAAAGRRSGRGRRCRPGWRGGRGCRRWSRPRPQPRPRTTTAGASMPGRQRSTGGRGDGRTGRHGPRHGRDARRDARPIVRPGPRAVRVSLGPTAAHGEHPPLIVDPDGPPDERRPGSMPSTPTSWTDRGPPPGPAPPAETPARARRRGPSAARSSSTAGGSRSRSSPPDGRSSGSVPGAVANRPRTAARPRFVPSSRGESCPSRSSPGDPVEAGQPLLVVEAMKMQNELRSPRDGIVARVAVGAGQTIEVGRPPGDPRMSRTTRPAAPPAPTPDDEAPDPARDRWRETLRAKALAGAPERRDPFETSSGIVVRDLYTRGRHGRARRGSRPRPARRVPVHPRRPADDVPQPLLDDAPVRGLRDGRGDQPALPLPPRAGPDRAVGRLRPADPDGLRLGRPGGRGRGRPGRGPDLEPGRHGDPARRPAARRGQHLDDDQRHGADPARPVRRRGRGPGRRAGHDLAGRPRTTSSRSTSPAAPTSSRRGRRCAS